ADGLRALPLRGLVGATGSGSDRADGADPTAACAPDALGRSDASACAREAIAPVAPRDGRPAERAPAIERGLEAAEDRPDPFEAVGADRRRHLRAERARAARAGVHARDVARGAGDA